MSKLSPLVYFTSKDVGCYADGTFGHDHCREKLSDMLKKLSIRSFSSGRYWGDIIKSLRGPMPDDAWDEQEALDILKEHTADGLVWTFEDGDLVLVEFEDDGSRGESDERKAGA